MQYVRVIENGLINGRILSHITLPFVANEARIPAYFKFSIFLLLLLSRLHRLATVRQVTGCRPPLRLIFLWR
jgi:hypothetical protein